MNQNYQAYTSADQEVWKLLFERQMQKLPAIASIDYLEGIDKAGFTAEHIPNFDTEINPRLQALTGWTVVACEGLVPIKEFFELLASKKFPASTWLRTKEQLEYLEEPDMFHDTFGHIPLLTNQAFCDFLAEFSVISLKYIHIEEAIKLLQKLYWFTVEFGLIRENNQLKIYGGGIISSSGESVYSLVSGVPERVTYNIEKILNTEVKIDAYQKKYFVIESYEQLYQSLKKFEEILERQLLVYQ
ncbi:Aromatic amino acid hydroxylase domain-containing protein [Emticicia oligotrophica DSM 17448]|uniref:phenylalanine 4-monooxygenase n=1 Tax=Emticicia oligotrophica (strain DSM 17448 / CIP 109782 / MTCC 6937 / GPTSA100-15) TaxID=929562 RepID=A0ABM5N5N5_EMTOG|nr:phenylalanine 4-monooxygenase [Emticicia oligotrophica]AFK04771.1 Aromatic amino acid hydroxylase domain-containing protein [Emticicia oligotrophica DSM 17448]